MIGTIIFAAFSMGLLGSPHCLGMCGGIVTAFGISMKSVSPTKKHLLMAGYHLGRLGSYLILGLLAAALGKHVLAPFLTNNDLPRYILGAALILSGLMMLGLPILSYLEKLGLGLWNKLGPIRTKILPINSLPKAVTAGLLWGFLPCGMVYGALIMALSLATQQQVGLKALIFMAFFWLGTLPMLLATGSVFSWLQTRISKLKLRQASGIIIAISGFAVAFSSPLMHSLHQGHDHSHHGHHDHVHHHDHNHHNHEHHHH